MSEVICHLIGGSSAGVGVLVKTDQATVEVRAPMRAPQLRAVDAVMPKTMVTAERYWIHRVNTDRGDLYFGTTHNSSWHHALQELWVAYSSAKSRAR